jgi:hypothetical protein
VLALLLVGSWIGVAVVFTAVAVFVRGGFIVMKDLERTKGSQHED